MQKRRIIIGLVGLLFITVISSSVQAQTASDSGGRLEERREAAQERKEAAMENRQQLRDQRKQAALERILTHIQNINDRVTDHFTRVLDRLKAILAKIRTRAERAQQNGKDISAVLNAITAADELIDNAVTAVNEQNAKIYEITSTDETTVRNDVQTLMSQLRADLKVTKDTVETARAAVHAALQALRTVIAQDGEGD